VIRWTGSGCFQVGGCRQKILLLFISRQVQS
jgi:hypothetical protein